VWIAEKAGTGSYHSQGFAMLLDVVELGMPMVDLARRFDLMPAAVSCAVQRGEKMAKEKDYQLETGDI